MSKKKLKLTTPKVTVVHHDGDETQGKQLRKTVSSSLSIIVYLLSSTCQYLITHKQIR